MTRITARKTTSYMLETMPARRATLIPGYAPTCYSLSRSVGRVGGNSRNEGASRVSYYSKIICTVNYL